MNLRIRDLREGDVIELDDAAARVSCALILDDEAIVVLDDEHGRQRTVTGALDAVRLISRRAPVAI
jgi:pyrimidine operon attenuation protein/uracil phosphoribosyltransferase